MEAGLPLLTCPRKFDGADALRRGERGVLAPLASGVGVIARARFQVEGDQFADARQKAIIDLRLWVTTTRGNPTPRYFPVDSELEETASLRFYHQVRGLVESLEGAGSYVDRISFILHQKEISDDDYQKAYELLDTLISIINSEYKKLRDCWSSMSSAEPELELFEDALQTLSKRRSGFIEAYNLIKNILGITSLEKSAFGKPPKRVHEKPAVLGTAAPQPLFERKFSGLLPSLVGRASVVDVEDLDS